MTRYDQAVLVVANALANRLQYERRQEPLQGWDYANKVLEIVLDHYERETGLTAFDLIDDAYNLITEERKGQQMTVTNNERREVATRLRANAKAHPHMGLLLNFAFVDKGLNPDGEMEYNVTSYHAALRLADLIEPEPERRAGCAMHIGMTVDAHGAAFAQSAERNTSAKAVNG